MYKKIYQRFLSAHPDTLHFACHSHHYWPDVTREAHLNYWEDSCKYVDKKWEYFFSTKVPRAQEFIARHLKLKAAHQIVFAPNTHEFVFRLLSSLDWSKKVRILTTDSEFYSFDRQINRLAESSQFEVVKVPTLPFTTFEERFEKELQKSWDLVFLSHVFFNSGFVCDIHRLARSATDETIFVVDGYHGFMALPTDLSSLQEKIFYLAGSYKYAQGGEGACFLYVPPAARHRPLYTGWFAELSHLKNVGRKVGYPEDALQYAGSTMDFSALYRLLAVFELFSEMQLEVSGIHRHIQSLQQEFLDGLNSLGSAYFNASTLLQKSMATQGHFLTFELGSAEVTMDLGKKLEARGVQTDSRGSRLRFGFGLYHDSMDIKKLLEKIQV